MNKLKRENYLENGKDMRRETQHNLLDDICDTLNDLIDRVEKLEKKINNVS